jgi:hypothetical protein
MKLCLTLFVGVNIEFQFAKGHGGYKKLKLYFLSHGLDRKFEGTCLKSISEDNLGSL